MERPDILKSGTTTVGLVCKDGVVLAADKKATMGYLVASKDTEKILKLEDHIALTTAGSMGDAQALARYMKAELKLFAIQHQRKISVKGSANLLSNILQSGRWTYIPYMVQLMLGGFDEGGPNLFSLDAIGSVEEERKFFGTGSGSPIALGVIEDKYKDGLSVDEGIKIAVSAIKAAVERDIASGGRSIDVLAITKDGMKHQKFDFGK